MIYRVIFSNQCEISQKSQTANLIPSIKFIYAIIAKGIDDPEKPINHRLSKNKSLLFLVDFILLNLF